MCSFAFGVDKAKEFYLSRVNIKCIAKYNNVEVFLWNL